MISIEGQPTNFTSDSLRSIEALMERNKPKTPSQLHSIGFRSPEDVKKAAAQMHVNLLLREKEELLKKLGR